MSIFCVHAFVIHFCEWISLLFFHWLKNENKNFIPLTRWKCVKIGFGHLLNANELFVSREDFKCKTSDKSTACCGTRLASLRDMNRHHYILGPSECVHYFHWWYFNWINISCILPSIFVSPIYEKKDDEEFGVKKSLHWTRISIEIHSNFSCQWQKPNYNFCRNWI